MKTRITKLLLLLFAVCYLQGVLEINVGPIQNSWNDEYDSYVISDNMVVKDLHKAVVHLDFALLPESIFSFTSEKKEIICITDIATPLETSFPKLFIRNCVWLI